MKVWDGAAWVDTDQGKILQVKSVALTANFSTSIASKASANVTGLSITHTVSSAANKVLLFASIGQSGGVGNNDAAGFAFAVDGSLINIGDASGDKTRVGSGVHSDTFTSQGLKGESYSLMAEHAPGAGSKTYTVRIINTSAGTGTVFVNRTVRTLDSAVTTVSASNFTLMEVAG
jgi:hypothetical protein